MPFLSVNVAERSAGFPACEQRGEASRGEQKSDQFLCHLMVDLDMACFYLERSLPTRSPTSALDPL
jgi:hypothetical protein